MTRKIKQTFYRRPAASLGEYYALKLLTLSLLKRQKGFDIRVPALSCKNGDSLRVEVKTAEFNKKGGWQFSLNKRLQHVWGDRFLIIGLDLNLEPSLMLWIPREKLVGINNLWIGKETISEWSKFVFV